MIADRLANDEPGQSPLFRPRRCVFSNQSQPLGRRMVYGRIPRASSADGLALGWIMAARVGAEERKQCVPRFGLGRACSVLRAHRSAEEIF
jgi:hypothetical protein